MVNESGPRRGIAAGAGDRRYAQPSVQLWLAVPVQVQICNWVPPEALTGGLHRLIEYP